MFLCCHTRMPCYVTFYLITLYRPNIVHLTHSLLTFVVLTLSLCWPNTVNKIIIAKLKTRPYSVWKYYISEISIAWKHPCFIILTSILTSYIMHQYRRNVSSISPPSSPLCLWPPHLSWPLWPQSLQTACFDWFRKTEAATFVLGALFISGFLRILIAAYWSSIFVDCYVCRLFCKSISCDKQWLA